MQKFLATGLLSFPICNQASFYLTNFSLLVFFQHQTGIWGDLMKGKLHNSLKRVFVLEKDFLPDATAVSAASAASCKATLGEHMAAGNHPGFLLPSGNKKAGQHLPPAQQQLNSRDHMAHLSAFTFFQQLKGFFQQLKGFLFRLQ